MTVLKTVLTLAVLQLHWVDLVPGITGVGSSLIFVHGFAVFVTVTVGQVFAEFVGEMGNPFKGTTPMLQKQVNIIL